jgi:hypothetical protein
MFFRNTGKDLLDQCFSTAGPSSYRKKNLPGRGLTKVENHCTTRFLRHWNKKNSFPGSVSALRSMVTMLKSKQRCVVKVLQVDKKIFTNIFWTLCLYFPNILRRLHCDISQKTGILIVTAKATSSITHNTRVHYTCPWNIAVQWEALLLRTGEVPAYSPSVLTEVLSGFPKFLQVNFRKKYLKLYTTTASFHIPSNYSLVMPPFDTMWSELTASLNKP